jgi:hypothetical protein
MIKVSTSGFRWQRRNYVSEGHFLESAELSAAATDVPFVPFLFGAVDGIQSFHLTSSEILPNQQ